MTDLIRSAIESELVLLYLKDKGIAGINQNALARLLGCNHGSTHKAVPRAVNQEYIVETEIPTAGGVQRVTFILEPGVIQILKYIRQGKFKLETKVAAEELYDRFALAGFKLYTMLKVAPEELRPMIPSDTTTTVNTTPPIADQANLSDKTNQIAALALKVSGKPGECALKVLEALIAYEST